MIILRLMRKLAEIMREAASRDRMMLKGRRDLSEVERYFCWVDYIYVDSGLDVDKDRV